jgi:hypothetical protein
MSAEIDNGGPAFPNRGDNTPTNQIYDGMSLRDWFAGMALSGTIETNASADDARFAQWAYNVADAMLAARKDTK